MTEKTSGRIRVVMADDSESMRRAVSRLLSVEFDVVGEAGDGKSALDAVAALQPDVAIVDILMPVMDGIQFARRIRAMRSGCKVVILTGMEDRDHILAALSAGASGFVFKRRMTVDLMYATHEVLAGRIFVSTDRSSGPDSPLT